MNSPATAARRAGGRRTAASPVPPQLFSLHDPPAVTPHAVPEARELPRLLVAWLPAFRLERCGWSAREVVALVAPLQNAVRVVACTPAAVRAGIRPGMGAAEARALLPELVLEHLEDEGEEQEDLAGLARRLEVFSPTTRALGQDALVVDLTGVAARHGGEAGAARRVLASLGELGHMARVVVVDADRADAARAGLALARHLVGRRGGAAQLVPPGGLAEALAEVPLALFEPSAELLRGLEALGVLTAGHLARLPAASVGGRHGDAGVALLEVCRAARAHEVARHAVHRPRAVPRRLEVSERLLEPLVDREALALRLEGLLERLLERLREAGTAMVRLELRLVLEDAPALALSLRAGRPLRESLPWRRLLRQRLEPLRLQGPAVELAMAAVETGPPVGLQRVLLERSVEPVEDVLTRLADALGEEALSVPYPANCHCPEAAWASTAWGEVPGQVVGDQAWRPALLRPSPLLVRVEVDAEGVPRCVELDGRWLGIVGWLAGSPRAERVCGWWWTDLTYTRDYHPILLEGGRAAWLYRDVDGGDWWIHGWFD